MAACPVCRSTPLASTLGQLASARWTKGTRPEALDAPVGHLISPVPLAIGRQSGRGCARMSGPLALGAGQAQRSPGVGVGADDGGLARRRRLDAALGEVTLELGEGRQADQRVLRSVKPRDVHEA